MIKQDKIFEFSGSHYDMGFQQGRIFKDEFSEIISVFKNLEDIQTLKPKWLPSGLFIKLAANRAKKWFKPIIKKYAPNQAERIKGIADGSELEEKYLYLFSAAELMLAELDWELPHIETGCTSIAFKSVITESSNTLIARNFDYAKFILPYLILRKNIPKGFNKTFDLTAFVLPGTFNGFNEHGVFIATDEAFPINERFDGLSASLIIQEALENCQNTDEVIKFFRKLPRGSGNVILIADPSDNIKVLEYTSKRLYIREPYENDEFIVATNHYTHPDLKEIDLPREAIFGKKSPKELIGICINETSYIRKETAERKIRSAQQITIEFIKDLLRDHSASENNEGGMNTICHHDPINITAASMIIDIKNFDTWFCFGQPCKNDYIKFSFK
ncbi:MAG: C45 family autoproteolytic acyltransferase/hydrolase [Promethearchaeota archaeon]